MWNNWNTHLYLRRAHNRAPLHRQPGWTLLVLLPHLWIWGQGLIRLRLPNPGKIESRAFLRVLRPCLESGWVFLCSLFYFRPWGTEPPGVPGCLPCMNVLPSICCFFRNLCETRRLRWSRPCRKNLSFFGEISRLPLLIGMGAGEEGCPDPLWAPITRALLCDSDQCVALRSAQEEAIVFQYSQYNQSCGLPRLSY